MFLLRPYVFASQKYEMYFGPWTFPDLPTYGRVPRTNPSVPGNDNPFVADLRPKARSVTVDYYGKQLDIAPPMISTAAILQFFTRGSSSTTSAPAVTPYESLRNLTLHPGMDIDILTEEVDASSVHSTETDGSDMSDLSPNRLMSTTSSKLHDRDFERLLKCHCPLYSRGMKPSSWMNSFNGSWEGTFSFFDFDAFREMLAGHSQALYTGPYGEQAQVWKLTETFVRPIRTPVETPTAEEEMKEPDTEADIPFEVIQAGGPFDDVPRENHAIFEDGAPSRGLPLTGPSTNAGFPTDLPPSTSAGLASAEAEAATLRETIRQQVNAIEGYEIVPPDELAEMFEDEDLETAESGSGSRRDRNGKRRESEEKDEGLEMLLTGTGHSAWGRFILKGRVRVWDGMATLVKEYAVGSLHSLLS